MTLTQKLYQLKLENSAFPGPHGFDDIAPAKIVKRAVRPPFIILPTPGFDLLFSILEGQKPINIQTFIPEAAIEGFDKGIIHRLARTAELKRHFVFIRPFIQLLRYEFRPIVNIYRTRHAACCFETIHYPGHILSLYLLPNLDHQAFTTEIIHYR